MGPEITAGLPASLTAIGLYSGIISVVGMACCSFVSLWERRWRAEEPTESAPRTKAPTPDSGPHKPIDSGQLRRDLLSSN